MDIQHLALRPNTCCYVTACGWKCSTTCHSWEKEPPPPQKKTTWDVMLIPNPQAGLPHRTHQSATLQVWTVRRTGKQTRADTCQPRGPTVRQMQTYTCQQRESIYIIHTGRRAANSIAPPSPPRFVWAINRNPLLLPSTGPVSLCSASVCLHATCLCRPQDRPTTLSARTHSKI